MQPAFWSIPFCLVKMKPAKHLPLKSLYFATVINFLCLDLLFLVQGSLQAQERCVPRLDLQVKLCSVYLLPLREVVVALGVTVGTTDSTQTPACPTSSRASSRNSWTHCTSEQPTWAQWPLRGSLQPIWWSSRNPLTTLMSLVSEYMGIAHKTHYWKRSTETMKP